MNPSVETAEDDWAIGAVEPALADMKAAIGVMRHMACSSAEVTSDEWLVILDKAHLSLDVLSSTWDSAWKQYVALESQHEADLATLKEKVKTADAERAAPGSRADAERAEALWATAQGFARMVLKQFDGRHGSPQNEPEAVA